MSTQQSSDQHASDRPETETHSFYHEHHHGLEKESYTSQRLRHASAQHLHMTSRRFFIGPIPEGWLQNHRKSWYKARLSFKNYTSRTVTFAADPVFMHYKQNADRIEPPSLDPQQDYYQTDATEGEETEAEQPNEPDEQETTDHSGALRTMSYPTVDPGEDSQSSASDGAGTSDPSPKVSKRGSANQLQDAASSYFTAREANPETSTVDTDQASSGAHIKGMPPGQPTKKHDGKKQKNLNSTSGQDQNRLSPITSASEADSATSLLRSRSSKMKGKVSALSTRSLDRQEPQSEETGGDDTSINVRRGEQSRLYPLSSRVARFNLDDNILDKQQRLRAKVSRTHDNISSNRPHRRKVQKGEIVKAEKMLVRVEETMQTQLPEDYTENDSPRMETRIVDKWREYLVVCRRCPEEHTPFSLQMYRTRVIPEVQKPGSRKAPYHEVRLNHKETKVNLYSSLDKTLVIWRPCERGTKIYIIRPRSAAHSVEWYTFIKQSLGWRRPSSLPIYVPDLGVSLIFKNPFEQLESTPDSKDDNKKNNGVLSRSAAEERFAAVAIIRGCMEMLENRSEWADVLKKWSKSEKMGLAWKRYDRLEWVFGVNEEKMYGTIAMQMSHELELRPRHHYPTVIKHHGEKEEEPQPVEGFLVRLTSQKGVQQRFNKMFFKRLYFFTQDHYLLFCRPAKAMPPPPPKLPSMRDSNVPSSRDILNEMPLSYDVDPYPVEDGDISWLSSGNQAYVQRHDEEAYAQFQRNLHNLRECDGYIDLCRVQEVRHVQRNSCPADPNIDEGPDVEFHPESRDTHRDDGATQQFDDDRTFEMCLDNGLVIRLQAYNDSTRDEWMKRLDGLVKYWKVRTAEDATEIKAVRQRNLELLDIDEEMESILGQFAKKWEVKKAEASPHLHNMCALSGCRTIKMSGQLYRKPRRHSTFKRCNVILSAGKLLVFRSSLRKQNGVEIPFIHHELETTIDLQDCYIYSGLLTESDLLYANQTFDSNHPGHHALPRVYLSSDVYTSCDEDTAISFVIWQPLRKNYFRAQEAGEKGQTKMSLRQVSALGVHGRTMVFKARSRVEKDRWVWSIASEIDRLQEERQEDIRIEH